MTIEAYIIITISLSIIVLMPYFFIFNIYNKTKRVDKNVKNLYNLIDKVMIDNKDFCNLTEKRFNYICQKAGIVPYGIKEELDDFFGHENYSVQEFKEKMK